MKPEWCPQEIITAARSVLDAAELECQRERFVYGFGTGNAKEVLDRHIARALLEAHQRGRREGMEEAAKVAESWEATSLRLARKAEPNSSSAIHHGVAEDMANDIKHAIRAKMEEQP